MKARASGRPNIYFSDHFGVTEQELDDHGAFDISLVTDLPLFIDPFLLFNSDDPQYQGLHEEIIHYLRFLRVKSEQGGIGEGALKAWYLFQEVKQNWLGFSRTNNVGHGLGRGFARALNANLVNVFRDFGRETVTRGHHLEKLCLISSGVGKDMISDFTTNLIKDYLLEYTQEFAQQHLPRSLRQRGPVSRAVFSYKTERWMSKSYDLPSYRGDFVILTPKNLLTRDDTWISQADMVRRFEEIPFAVDNDQLRAEMNAYLYAQMPKDREPSSEDKSVAARSTLMRFPQLIDFYIRLKEDDGDQATSVSGERVSESEHLYVQQFGEIAELLGRETPFYGVPGNTKEETRQKIEFFKDVVENKGGHLLFYDRTGQPIEREQDVQIMFRLVWFGTPSDVSRETNDGRGPADFKISRGSKDKTLVEFKLASNSHLKKNLQKQLEIYQAASDAEAGYKVIVFFSEQQLTRVNDILEDLGMLADSNIFLVDARRDNKPSGSMA
jgi:hypothetical protein